MQQPFRASSTVSRKKPVSSSDSELKYKFAEIESKAKVLYDLIEERKTKEKQEKELKDYFKANFPNGVVAGDYCIISKQMSRRSLDRDQLELDFGADEIKKYDTVSEYLQLSVTKNIAVILARATAKKKHRVLQE